MDKKSIDFDDYSDKYNEILNSQLEFLGIEDEYFAQYKVDLLKKMFHKDPTSLLEYGCGIGRNLCFLSHAFPETKISACDISSKSINIAKKKILMFLFITIKKNLFQVSLKSFLLQMSSIIFLHLSVRTFF